MSHLASLQDKLVQQGRGGYCFEHNFAIHHLTGETERCVLTSVADVRATLQNVFHITLPEIPELDSTLQRLIASSDPE